MKLVEKVTRRVVWRLQEDAEMDRMFRKQARDVYNKLVDYLGSGGGFYREGPARVVRIDQFTDLEEDAPKPLKIKWYDKDMGRADAKYVERGGPEIRLYVLEQAIFDSESGARFAMKKGLQNQAKIFMHEYIHYLDDRRTEAGIQDLASYDPGDKRMSVYFSDDFEVNAYFQSGLAQTEELLEEPGMVRALMDKWDSDFRNFKEWFFDNHIPPRMEFNISDDQRKRIINRLYGFWDNFVKSWSI